MPIASPPKAVLRTADVIYAPAASEHPEDADWILTGSDDHIRVNADVSAGARKLLFLDGTVLGLQINLVDDLKVKGMGRGITTFKLKNGCSQAEADAETVAVWGPANGVGQVTNVELFDMTIDGNKANQNAALVTPGEWYFCGVALWNGAYRNALRRLEVKNCASGGVYVEGFQSPSYYRSFDILLDDIITHENGYAGGFGGTPIYRGGVELDKAHGAIIRGLRSWSELHYDINAVDSYRIDIDGWHSTNSATQGGDFAAATFNGGCGRIDIAQAKIWTPNMHGLLLALGSVPGVITLDQVELQGQFVSGSYGIKIAADHYDVSMTHTRANAFQTNFYCNDARKIFLGCGCNFDNADQPGSGTLGYNIDLYACDEVHLQQVQSRWANQHCLMINGTTKVNVEDCELHDYHDESVTYALTADAASGQPIIYISTTNARNLREGDVIHVQETAGSPAEKARIKSIFGGQLTLKDNLTSAFQTANSALIHKLNGDSYRIINEQGAADYNRYKGNRYHSADAAKFAFVGTHNEYDDRKLSDELDLSGAAIDVDTFRVRKAGILCGYWIHYTEASSADAGVDIRIGRYQDGVALDDNYFDNTTSEVSKNLGYSTYITLANLTQSALAAGDIITVGTAGGKTGTGNVRIELDIMYGLD